MARFGSEVKSKTTGKRVAGKKVINHQGGESYALGPKKELATFLLTSFMNGSFHTSGDAQHARLVSLISQVDPTFAAKAAIYARDKFGMRTVTHVVGARLPQLVKGEPWMKGFISNLIVRPDDASEMIAYHKSKIGGPIPNSLKKGVQLGLGKFNAYQMDKWNKGNFNLVDTINLVTGGRNGKFRGSVISDVANKLVKGELESAETWESALSQAGQAEDAEFSKATAWGDIVLSGKIGQMALLKNLRNILEASSSLENGDDVVAKAAELLTNEGRVKSSRIFPFRYITAGDELKKLNSKITRSQLNTILKALNTAMEISVISAVPVFEGRTVIAVDSSGSMTYQNVGGERAVQRPVADVAAQLAGFMYKANPDNTDVLFFDGTSRWAKDLNPLDPAQTVVDKFRGQIGNGGATYFHTIFGLINNVKAYDRVIILSDMQGADSIKQNVADYRKSKNAEVFIHSVDMVGHGTSMFPENSRLATYAGFSEKMFELMAKAEQDINILVHEIEAVTF